VAGVPADAVPGVVPFGVVVPEVLLFFDFDPQAVMPSMAVTAIVNTQRLRFIMRDPPVGKHPILRTRTDATPTGHPCHGSFRVYRVTGP
jgi:hypothetical protein